MSINTFKINAVNSTKNIMQNPPKITHNIGNNNQIERMVNDMNMSKNMISTSHAVTCQIEMTEQEAVGYMVTCMNKWAK